MRHNGGMQMVVLFVLSFLVVFTALHEPSFAATADYPKREITIIVNYGPGGAKDILARGVGKTLKKYMGVPVVIQNIVGAGGMRGLTSLYNAPPDGYTIGVGTNSEIIFELLEKQDFSYKKFTYIGNVQHSSPIWFVKSDSPFRTLEDFKTYGKPIRHSTFSLNSNSTVAAMIVANREKFPLLIVGGYASASDGILALIRGEAEFSSSAPSVAMQYLRSGQLRPFMAIGDKRSPEFPDVTSIAEVGHPGVGLLANDYCFMAPPGVPEARAKLLENAIMKTIKDPDFLKWTQKAGIILKPMTGSETTKTMLQFYSIVEQYKGDIEKYVKQ